MSQSFFVALAGVIGLAVGSFINVVAYRVPRGESITYPPSACASCSASIAVRDNIPVVSWFLLRGKCRSCKARISLRYPIVEVATGVSFVVTTAWIGDSWSVFGYLLFVAVTITLTLTDLDHKRIPNRILFPGTAVCTVLLGMGALLDGNISNFGWALVGGITYFCVLLVLALAVRGGLGFGDVKLAALLGMFVAYLGWGQLVVAIVLPFLGGGLVSLFLLATRLRGRKDSLPFGPYMVAGSYVAALAGESVIDWYVA